MRACYKLKISTLILRDISELKLKLKAKFESKKISKYWDLKINLSIRLKRFLLIISFLKIICNKASLMSDVEFIIITNLILCCFDINIIINNSKLNEIIIDLRSFHIWKKKKLLFFNRAVMLWMSILILKKTSFIRTSTRMNCFYDMKLMSNFEI